MCRAGSLGLGWHNFDIACVPECKLKIGVGGGDEAPSRVCPISYPLLAFLSCRARILDNDLKGMYFRQKVTLSMMKDSQS